MFGNKVFRAFVVLMCLTLALAPQAALADTVDNPGSCAITAYGGYIKIGSDRGDVDPTNPVTLEGEVDAQGNLVVPTAGIVFPERQITGVPVLGTVTVRIEPQGDGIGTLNPITGESNITISLRVRLINRLLPGGCGIGPVTIPLTTGVSGLLEGRLYNQEDGTLTWVNNTFAVPRSSGCGIYGRIIDQFANLPSNPPNNEAVLDVQFDPIFTGSEPQ